MTSRVVQFGDWRPSYSGVRYHYGHGPVAICGVSRMTYDAHFPQDKCVRCISMLKHRSKDSGLAKGVK